MLVCPLEGPSGLRGKERFLRVTSAHLLEVGLQAARTLERLELPSLESAELEPEPQADGAPGEQPPVLALRFSYICPDRQLRRYLVLEPDARAAVQELLAVLTTASTPHPCGHLAAETRGPVQHSLQCLRCGHEFKPEEASLEPQKTDSPVVVCPSCGSDHVVLLTLSPGEERRPGEQVPRPSRSPSPACDPSGCSDPHGRASVSQDHGSWGLSPSPDRRGLRAVDHRLRLFLDMEVFAEAQEEFQCCLKVPVVLASPVGETPSLVVASDRRLYVLRVMGETRGPPASWLQLVLAVPLQDLSGIELGLAGQSLQLEWAAGGSRCVLLPRDARPCRAFLGELTDVLQSLPCTRRSCVRATEEAVTPRHRLWPLLGTASALEPPRFFYLRVFLVEGPSPCPVSLLLTLPTLYLLDEAETGPQAEPPAPSASAETLDPPVRVREQQPLSSLSSVQLYRWAPHDLRLTFYDEVSRLESFWALRVACPEQLTALLAWLREPWEELFSIELRTVTCEAGGPHQ